MYFLESGFMIVSYLNMLASHMILFMCGMVFQIVVACSIEQLATKKAIQMQADKDLIESQWR